MISKVWWIPFNAKFNLATTTQSLPCMIFIQFIIITFTTNMLLKCEFNVSSTLCTKRWKHRNRYHTWIQKMVGILEVNEKRRYIKLCESLKNYNIALFLAKVIWLLLVIYLLDSFVDNLRNKWKERMKWFPKLLGLQRMPFCVWNLN